jgi:hypothetical protein
MTAKEVAEWMFEKIQKEKEVYQEEDLAKRSSIMLEQAVLKTFLSNFYGRLSFLG